MSSGTMMRRAYGKPAWRRNLAGYGLVAPIAVFLLLAFLLPLGFVFGLSITEPTVSLGHFRRIVDVPAYLMVMWNTFRTALTVTLTCLVLGYPIAYVVSRRSDAVAVVMLGIVAMSFWTSFLVRTYAWLVILGNSGPVAALYGTLGLGPMPKLLFTSFSSTMGLVHILLPYMVLALYSVMKRIDPSHIRAAHSLGATPWVAFTNVYLPLSLPGIVSGSIVVFTVCLGFYVTPILLGGSSDMMISQLIHQQIDQLLNWGFAAALSVVLLAATALIYSLYNHFFGLDTLWK
ncbi:ABC transporter permease [Bosea sp. (in: a-proteobacteria)]|uniref:ABC transporter permease n=1 Tax=Bosea sp. (in: a-proteobacteria) TaxID=1871050 RepID=UPI0026251018|nr:ABC transporter permease [Bosea sp. (in: a-proteobacteria)]MCO5091697.1 ABC transporter permease [Bosea sp. (in: a-proteobacteria)]